MPRDQHGPRRVVAGAGQRDQAAGPGRWVNGQTVFANGGAI
nr:hypothetical protein [Asanoa hainanensis]